MSIGITKLKSYAELCTRDDPPFCRNVCPLDIDVTGLITRVSKGDFTAAYKHYRNSVLFPCIVSAVCDQPCKSACIRKDIDEGVNLKAIEKACCEYTGALYQENHFIPPKNKSIGVIGGGLGGLGCAVKLGRRGYNVHLYEKSGRPGGSLWDCPDAILPREILKRELSYLENENIIFHFEHPVEALNKVRGEHDSVYIATGASGTDFNLREGYDPIALSTRENGVFLSSGANAACYPLQSLREGILVSTSIEGYLKVGRMEGKAGLTANPPSRLAVERKDEPVKPAVVLNEGGVISREQAEAEAGRCMLCECKSCMAGCELLTMYKNPPKKVIEDVGSTLNAMKAFTTRIASRQINSCSLCGRCRQVCPNSLDMESLFLESRRQLYREKGLPAAFHDYWIRDLSHAMSDDAYIAWAPESKCDFLFFPGCQLGSSDPAYVKETWYYLTSHLKSAGILLSCCGAPAYWAGREETHNQVNAQLREAWTRLGSPKVVFACPTCKKILMKFNPDWSLISLYDIIAEYGLQNRSVKNAAVTVFDSCSARNEPQMQKNVRAILRRAGYQLFEMQNHGEATQCCGYGGLIQEVNPQLLETIVEHRISASKYDYITYCTNCRDTFASKGKKAAHILDFLITGPIEERMVRKVPTLTQRRYNREDLKDFVEGLAGLTTKFREEKSPVVYIDEALSAKMNRELILEEDARRTIRFCEKSGYKLFDPGTGSFAGHFRDGMMTYWVIYRPEANGYRLLQIYYHRMEIEEACDGSKYDF